MSFSLFYWILMLLWLLFGFWAGYGPTPNYRFYGGHVLLFVLLVLLGWKVFGAPLRP